MASALRRLRRRAVGFFLNHIQPRIALSFSFMRSPHQLVSAWPDGDPVLGPRVAVFVHYDRRGAVRDFVRHYLAAIDAAGFDIVFVSNSGRLQREAAEWLRTVCKAVLVRRNVGYDFSALREALARMRLPRADTECVLLLNDSVYGPLRPLDDLLAAIDFDAADIWGATESWQSRYHLQSYFLAVSPRVLRHPAWASFWRRVRPVASKAWVIFKYEIGLTQRLLRAGLRVRAVYPYGELIAQVDPELLLTGEEPHLHDPIAAARRHHALRIRRAAVSRQPLNPTSDLWRQLLLAGFPFLKRELLRENPTEVGDVTDWRQVVVEYVGGDPAPIDQDLQRVLKNRAP